MIRLKIKNCHHINNDAAKISALSSGKIYKYEYPTGEEILSPDQRRVIEQAKVAYSPLGEAFQKKTKTKSIQDPGEKQIKAIEEHGKQLIKSSIEKDRLELLKQKEPFDESFHEWMFEKN